MPIRVGTRFGAYEVTSSLGSGGMGEVYRARDTNLKRDVALKTLPPAVANDADRLARFQREAEVLASLNHPNIAHVYGLERSEGATALAMELIEGPTLADRIAEGPLPVEEALKIAGQVADALEAAHERGVVHRDLKPANVKLRPDGIVKVLDFGIAKALDTRATAGPGPAALTTPAMTEVGMILGTAAYMSPEQARGRPVDRRTDIWAFGCVLYEMFTGKAAFLGEDVTSTLARVLQGSADLSALPPDVSATVRRTLELCLEKDARKRIADVADVRLGLAGVFAPPAPTPAPVQPLWRRALPSAATLVVGLLLASIYFLGSRPPASLPANVPAPSPVSRFVITPPATAPLASLGGEQVAISPDGKRIAYFAEKPGTGNVELYVRELDALDARPIPGTEGPSTGNMNLFFSADDKSIGYFAPDRGGVISVTIDGRPSVKMLDGPSPAFIGATWAPDNRIIYSSGNRLQRVSAGGGGTPEPLMPERQGVIVAAPVLLPGGRAVLFQAVEGGNDFLKVLDLETREEKRLVEGGATPSYADSGHIVFVRGTTLMAVPFRASELAITGEPVAVIQGVRHTPGGAAHFSLSATGTLVYEPTTDDSGSEALSAVVWVDRKGAVVGRALSDLVINPRDPRLSPDGAHLLLVTGSVTDGDLWSYDLGGRPPIPLALPGDNRFPVWSPDSRQVAFARMQGFPEIFTMPADGSVLTPQSLRGPMPIGAPQVWSDAGELIVVRVTGNTGDILAVPASSAGEVRPVVASQFAEYAPALSPNGRWLAYVSDRSGAGEIWVQGYPDGVPVRVSRNGGYEPLWSRDGRELFYWEGNAMMDVAVTTDGPFVFNTPVQLFSGRYLTFPTGIGRGYDVARDGRFLLIQPGNESKAAAPRSIVVVQNFAEELKQRVRPSAK